MIDSKQVKNDMAVVGSDNAACATVDHLQGAATIKLKKDDKGQHHFIPLAWVASVDDKVHLSKTAAQVAKEWQTQA